MPSYFSDWHKLRRFVALMRRGVRGFRHSKSDNASECDPHCVRLSADDLLQAEKTVVQWVQDELFPGVVNLLQSEKTLLLMGFYASVATSEMRQSQMTWNIPWYFLQIHQSLNFLFGPSIRDVDMVGGSRFYPDYEKGTGAFMVMHSFVACWDLVWSVDDGFMVLCNRKWRTCRLIVWHLISLHSVTQGWTILVLYSSNGVGVQWRDMGLFSLIWSPELFTLKCLPHWTRMLLSMSCGVLLLMGDKCKWSGLITAQIKWALRENSAKPYSNGMRAKLSPSSSRKTSLGVSMRQGHHIMVALGNASSNLHYGSCWA